MSKPTKAHAHDWEPCPGSDKRLDIDKRQRIRCPECKRRLTAKVNNCYPCCIPGFITYTVPRHKPKKKKAKQCTSVQ